MTRLVSVERVVRALMDEDERITQLRIQNMRAGNAAAEAVAGYHGFIQVGIGKAIDIVRQLSRPKPRKKGKKRGKR